MLKLLKIKNFQSHKRSILRFDSGVNAIVGGTDSGKTAIFRAFNWLAGNLFSTGSFKSHWGGKTLVKVITSEGNVIVRSTGKKGNKYTVNGVTLKAFGKTIPTEVIKALNVEDINYQSQHSPPFMLANTGGEVARMLNKFANIDIVDSAQSNAKRAVRTIGDNIKTLEEQIQTHKESLTKFEFVDELEKEVSTLEEINAELQQLEKKHSSLTKLVKEINEIDISALNIDINKLRTLSREILQEKTALEKAKDLQDRLSVLVDNIAHEREYLADFKNDKEEAEKELKKIMPERCPLCNHEI